MATAVSVRREKANDAEGIRARILIVDDHPLIRQTISEYLAQRQCAVSHCETLHAAEQLVREQLPDVLIIDYMLPDGNALEVLPRLRNAAPSMAVIILTGYGSIDLAVRAIKEGAEHFLTKPVELATLWVLVERILENARIRRNETAQGTRQRNGIDPFAGVSRIIRELAEQAQIVAGANSPVLIQGETGSGKGVLARWLHAHSARAKEPFVDLNCAGLSKDFLESELFGHERGAFTGAVAAKQGLFETAHRGTLFLDEIGDIDPQVQPKLLKVLEEQRFRRLGEVRDRVADVRLLAATHENLHVAQRERRFREDLYFRISTIRLTMPSLRERPEDIPALARQFLARFAAELGRGTLAFDQRAEEALRAYRWPGNIRELRNVIERAVLLTRAATLSERDLHFDFHESGAAAPEFDSMTLDQLEKAAVERALARERGRVGRAAARLGIARSSLYHRIRKFDIDLSRF
ncbi:MAG: sigma-54-dependent Fis family transcriptional regulator [Acidobacteria bacterium]|nr:sigma-54-dependent Fis family transcriptional regulator [Acidobacteriota bacterium]MBV9477588.1 sigma-54-dependent Fis family transcriptional regulator [Acidobacteriota bacterium]